jgi:hypothetical protein
VSESVPRYTSTAEGFRDAKELARLRPVKANAPRPRKPAGKPAVVASGIVCFCGERFSEAQSLEFMKHLRAEVGRDLALVNRRRAYYREWMKEYSKRPGVRERATERERERIATDPEYRERRHAAARERSRNPEVRARANERKRERIATDPEYRDRVYAQNRASAARKKAEREAGNNG